jgi:DivIVA domain-containing protein
VKKKETQMDDEAQVSAPAPSTSTRMLTPLDIQQKEFRVGTRGYKMRDVDEFLDQLTEAMTAVIGENERLRTGAPASPGIGTADLDDTNRQADEIIQRARDEAERITADAKGQAVTMAAAGVGSGSAADRAAVNAFLGKEREFLQDLAGLVQGHAESVKGMAKASRQASSVPPASVATPATAPKPSDAKPAPTKPSTAPATTAPAKASTPEPEETVMLQEPEPASVGRAEGDEPAEGDSSLRELFWGED